MNHAVSPFLKQAAIAVALCASSFGASALNAFTLDPAAAGLAGSSFTADNLLISDYATVTNTGGGGFTETGFLRITGAQFEDDLLLPAGLNSSYSLYISFTGTGTTSGNPLTGPTSGTFGTLSYDLWIAPGNATFGFTGNTATTTASGSIKLASGTLVSGTVNSSPQGSSFSPSANAVLTFNPEASQSGFFDPNPFFNQALTSFSNTSSQVTSFAGGFMISKGGGSINFATAVPEPESYAMLLAGLVVIGSLARRRGMKR
jgi:hypothetical protein